MKKLFHLLLIVLILGACAPDNQTTKDVKQYSIDQFMSSVNSWGGEFTPDEKNILITSNSSGIYNAYLISVDGGDPVALTQSDTNTVIAVSFFPKDERLLYMSDDNGDERYHIFLKDLDGSVQDITPFEGARSLFYGWNFDEESFLYATNKRDERFMDIYELDIESFKSELIFENNEGLDYGGISRDERFMVFNKPVTTNNNNLYLLDRESGELNLITEHEGDISYGSMGFTHDSKSLYHLTDEGSEFKYYVKYDIETGEREKILEYDWDIWYAYLSYNDKYRVVGINEDAQTVVKIFDMESGKEIDLPISGAGEIKGVNISKSEEIMTFWVGNSRSPSDLYIYNFKTEEAKQLTSSLNPEINIEDLVDGEVVRYKSFDELEIPAILYKPHQASKDSLSPVLVWVHGGPGGQSRVSYFGLVQYLVNHGYAVLAVNNRGSSGYGKTFFAMDDRNHGEADLMDCIYGKKYLQTLNYVDTGAVGIIGGSYGGFMVMAALTLQPEAFNTGVNIFGVTNWLRTLKSIPPWWESFREALYTEMGDPAVDSVRLHKISPVFHADKITKPFIVLQGAQDPRVLQVESDEIVENARNNGVFVEYVLFEDEGHGFVKKENEIEGYGKILEFLDERLRD